MTKFVDMAKTETEMAAGMMPTIGDQSRYDYGLCLCFSQETLDKLKADADSIEVGDMIDFRALAKVTSKTKNDTGDGEKNRVELQICFLSAELEGDESEV